MLEARVLLRKDVMLAEGCRLKPYLDCCGKYWRDCVCTVKGRLTISFGRNLDDVGISALEAEVLLDHDLAGAELSCRKAFEWFADLNDARQRCVVELVFNLGLRGFMGFGKTIAAIKAGDWLLASQRLVASRWATQVGPTRSTRLATMMRDGKSHDNHKFARE